METKSNDTVPPFLVSAAETEQKESGDILKTMRVASKLARNYHLRNFSIKSIIPTEILTLATESDEIKQDYGSNLSNYLQFCPECVINDLVKSIAESSTISANASPSTSSSFAALLFADISGFTMLSSRLGAEELKIHTNRYFSMLLDCIAKYKGDVIKFCGDAVMIIWPCSVDSAGHVRSCCVTAAADCGIALVQQCGLYQSGEGENSVELSLHCGLGCGIINSFIVGSNTRREFLISGEVLKEVGEAESEATREQIFITSAASKHLGDLFLCQKSLTTENFRLLSRLPQGSIFQNFSSPNRDDKASAFGTFSFRSSTRAATKKETKKRVTATPDSVNAKDDSDSADTKHAESCPLFFEEHDSLESSENNGKMNKFQSLLPSQKSVAAEILRSYLHESARHVIESLGFTHIAELRNVITLFVNIKGLEEDFAIANLDKVQRTMLCCLQSFSQFGGALRQFVVDDKGCVMIGSFGLPQFTHEDDGIRAIEAACMIRTCLRHEVSLTCSIGISRGMAFCGLVGTQSRCEYAMMGCCVNLAARLMAAAPANEILVESEIYSITDKAFEFQCLPPIKAKGYVNLVPVYRPTCRVSANIMLSPSMANSSSPEGKQYFAVKSADTIFVGREEELEVLQSSIIRVKEDRVSLSINIAGDVGIGKTKLIAQIIPLAESLDFSIWACGGASAHVNTSFFIICQLISCIIFSSNLTSEKLTNENSPPERSLLRQWSMASRKLTAFSNSTCSEEPENPTSPVKLSPLKPRSYSNLNSRAMCLQNWVFENIGEQDVSIVTDSSVKAFPVSHLLSLLSTILSLGRMDEHESVVLLNSKEKDMLRIEFLALIIQTALKMQMYLIIIENVEFVDKDSQKVLNSALNSSKSIGSGIIMFTTRQLLDSQNLKYFRLPEACSTLSLKRLKDVEREELIKIILGKDSDSTDSLNLEQSISDISSQSNGNPLVVENLAHALKDRLTNPTNDAQPLGSPQRLPDTITGVVMERFDKLVPEMQLVLKVASVVGNEFPLKIIADVCRNIRRDERFGAYRHLLDLLNRNFIVRRVCDNEAIFSFVHESTRETIYQLMLKSQKQQFHQFVGDWYRQNKRQDKSFLQTELLHHAVAEDIPRLVECAEIMINDELKAFNWEKVVFLSQMLVKLSSTSFKAEEVPAYLKIELATLSPRMTARGDKLFPSALKIPSRNSVARTAPVSAHHSMSLYRNSSVISEKDSQIISEFIGDGERFWVDEDSTSDEMTLNDNFDGAQVAEWLCYISTALLQLGELEISHSHCLKALSILHYPICSNSEWKSSLRIAKLKIRVLTQNSDVPTERRSTAAIRAYSNLVSVYLQSSKPHHCFYICRMIDIVLDEANLGHLFPSWRKVALDGYLAWLLTDDHLGSVRPRVEWVMNQAWTTQVELYCRNLQNSGTIVELFEGEFENDDNAICWLSFLSSWINIYQGDTVQSKINLFSLRNASKWLSHSYCMLNSARTFRWLSIMEGKVNPEEPDDPGDSMDSFGLMSIVENRRNNSLRSMDLMEGLCNMVDDMKHPPSYQMPIILSLVCLEATRMISTSENNGHMKMVCMPISWTGRVISSGSAAAERLGNICERLIKALKIYGKYIVVSETLAAALDIRLSAAQGRVDKSIKKRWEFMRQTNVTFDTETESLVPYHIGFYHLLASKSLLDEEMIRGHVEIANKWMVQTGFNF